MHIRSDQSGKVRRGSLPSRPLCRLVFEREGSVERIWIDTKTNLFISENGERRPLRWTGIKQIVWDTDYYFSCPRCGSSIVSREQKYLPGTCRHCGFTAIKAMESIGNALVTFEGMLPKCLDLIYISEKTVVELLYSECGFRDHYDEEDILLRFSDCIVVGQSMTYPVRIFREGDQPEPLSILVKIKCNAEWL